MESFNLDDVAVRSGLGIGGEYVEGGERRSAAEHPTRARRTPGIPAANPVWARLSARSPHSVLSAASKRMICVTSNALIRDIYVFALIKSLTGMSNHCFRQ
ncbi:hypothetical protein E2553_29210 [Paraburkholderia dipogonis]|uniref:Uncharacterized protein n=1 Tax=Paraburkholderia dipogonis TaxID=1211383 RepID=A0A4Y8MTR1_9BURK|nr:hypothetical protein [Paraburkholderia dipogonis]TFE40792.1 hypothetical protein E2553_29210 [Paraburkholderia dipogonis]